METLELKTGGEINKQLEKLSENLDGINREKLEIIAQNLSGEEIGEICDIFNSVFEKQLKEKGIDFRGVLNSLNTKIA